MKMVVSCRRNASVVGPSLLLIFYYFIMCYYFDILLFYYFAILLFYHLLVLQDAGTTCNKKLLSAIATPSEIIVFPNGFPFCVACCSRFLCVCAWTFSSHKHMKTSLAEVFRMQLDKASMSFV